MGLEVAAGSGVCRFGVGMIRRRWSTLASPQARGEGAMGDPSRVGVIGPLERNASGFAGELARQGYTAASGLAARARRRPRRCAAGQLRPRHDGRASGASRPTGSGTRRPASCCERSPTAVGWATLPAAGSGHWWAFRISAVRGFAAYLHALDPGHEVPPADLFPNRTPRAIPYL